MTVLEFCRRFGFQALFYITWVTYISNPQYTFIIYRSFAILYTICLLSDKILGVLSEKENEKGG